MFCHRCRRQFADGELFCTQCGTQRMTENKVLESSSSNASGKGIKTLEQYMSSKSKERQFFSKKRKDETMSTSHSLKKTVDNRVVISVGIIAENEKGNLSTVRESKIPVHNKPSWPP